jgi:hypothetical protein
MRLSHARRRGQALAEFALVVPVLLLVLFAIVDISRLVYASNAMSNAAREGARAGSVGTRPTGCTGMSREACVIAIAKSRAWGVAPDSITTTVSCERVAPGDPTPNGVSVATCRTDDLLRVRSQTTFTLLTPLAGQFVGGIPVTGESVVTVHT